MISTMSVDIAKKFGRKVRKIRLDRGLSQGKLAEKLGVDPSYVSQIERGVNNMSLRKIEQVAKMLDVSIEKLLK